MTPTAAIGCGICQWTGPTGPKAIVVEPV